MFRRTIMLITEYDPNRRRAQNLVKLLIPARSNDIRSTNPKEAQNKDCEVSKRLKYKIFSQKSSWKIYGRSCNGQLTWQIFSRQCRLSHSHQNLAMLDQAAHNISSFLNQHNTTLTDSCHSQKRIRLMYK